MNIFIMKKNLRVLSFCKFINHTNYNTVTTNTDINSGIITSFHSCRFYSSSTKNSLHSQHVGFIGLGNMGSHMANNLIKAGYELSVYDLNQNVIKSFAARGIITKESPCEIAEASDIVITMLPSPSHVLDVYTGPNGLLSSGNTLRPWLFIDSSTIDPQTSRKVSTVVSKFTTTGNKVCFENPVMLDAPVSGGVLAAETGTLTFMVGGSEESYLAAEPLFLAMGRNTFYCGGAGNGSAAKICNNLALAISMIGVSEGFALGQYLGIPASILTRIYNSSSARCWSSDSYNPVPGLMEGVPSSKNFESGFSSKLMAKDLNLATSSAKNLGVMCPLTQQAEKIYLELCEKGYAAQDFSCVFRHYYFGKDEQQ